MKDQKAMNQTQTKTRTATTMPPQTRKTPMPTTTSKPP